MPVGVFGKYPGRRDFISVGVPRPVLGPLEGWLQAGMAASKESIGKHWKEMFLVQPIWNFRLGRAIGGVDCLGAMMPSVDGIGRYFPLCAIAFPADRMCGYPLWVDLDIGGWLETLHKALLSALADGDLPEPPDIVKGVEEPRTVTLDHAEMQGQRQQLRLDPAAGDAQAMRDAVVGHSLAFAGSRQSVWWTEGGAHVARQVRIVAGMPEPQAFAEMMGQN